ncbi:MAG: Trk family potassium uptake protein [Anaerolineales bacterium]|nr:Trk family potassium uptake protein [Anaerolineales bacterium]
MINYRQIRQYTLENPKKAPSTLGAKILIFGFAVIILIGSFLLALPLATEGPGSISWLDALFTSTSATTVTGLGVVSTEATFSLFGEIVILLLMQVGGMGFIILSIALFRLIGRHVTFYERSLLRQNLGVEEGHGIIGLAWRVIQITLMIEFIGAIVLFSQWVQVMDWRQAVYYSIFHSVSAFCNAGFDLFHSFDDPILLAARHNPITLTVLCFLITIGTLGVTVIYDLIQWPRDRRLSLHTRLVLPFTIILTIMGTFIIMIDETFVQGHALSLLSTSDRWWLAFFTAVSSRTAGITLIPMADLGEASQFVIVIWMFIGGAPASMGGGVGLTTVAVVLITLISNVRGHEDIRFLERSLPLETVTKAVAIMTVSTILVVVVTLLLAILEQGRIFPLGFEVISAFSNTGYSLGITSSLGVVSRLLIIFTMFWGRLGPLTLVVALAQRHRRSLVHFPEEKIIIG